MSPRPTPADPLADLRTPEAPPALPTASPEPEQAAAPEPAAAHDQVWHDETVAGIVGRWHDDGVAMASLHKGGTCPCRHLAVSAVVAVVGLPVPLADHDPDPDPDGDA